MAKAVESATRAAEYFASRSWSRMMHAVRARYESLGRIGGHAIIERATPSEVTAVRVFFGKRPAVTIDGHMKVSLQALDDFLQKSAFRCSLTEVLSAYFEESIVTRPAQVQADEEAFARFVARVAELFGGVLGTGGPDGVGPNSSGSDGVGPDGSGSDGDRADIGVRHIHGVGATWWASVCMHFDPVVPDRDVNRDAAASRTEDGIIESSEAAAKAIVNAAADTTEASRASPRGEVPSGAETAAAHPRLAMTARWVKQLWRGSDTELWAALNLVAAALTDLHEQQVQVRPVRLPVFANRVTGDPHAFDAGSLPGRLLERILLDAHPHADTLLAGVDSPTLQRDLVLESAGILRDDVSSFVLVWGLPAAVAGHLLPPRFAFQLPLREIKRLQFTTLPTKRVFVVENPAVFGEIVDALDAAAEDKQSTTADGGSDGDAAPIVVCTSGFPSLAALKLLDRLVPLGAEIVYSGDFDDTGLIIAESILRRYGHAARPWRMTADDYERACIAGGGGVPLSGAEQERLVVERTPFEELLGAMRRTGRKAYQEGIIEELVADVLLFDRRANRGRT